MSLHHSSFLLPGLTDLSVKGYGTEFVREYLGKGLSTRLAIKRYEHELKVTTSTIQYSQGPWYSTVHNNHSNTSTHVQGAVADPGGDLGEPWIYTTLFFFFLHSGYSVYTPDRFLLGL